MDELPLFSTPPEVARLLRVKADRVTAWIKRGELKASNLGDRGQTRYRIAKSDLQAFLDKRAPHPPAPVLRRRKLVDEPVGPY